MKEWAGNDRLTASEIEHIYRLLERAKEQRRTFFGRVKTTRAEVAEIVLASYVPRLVHEIKMLMADDEQ